MKENDNVINIWIYHSPCGDLMLGSFDGKLCICDWMSSKRRNTTDRKIKMELKAEYKESKADVIELTIRQLDEYFAGKRKKFNIPLLFIGTDFQRNVWNKLFEIPYAKTISYGDLAKQLNRPTAIRAVANSNGANPIAIIVPCHRVIGSNHSLTGYAGGLDVKQFLLNLEQRSAIF